LRNEEVKSYTVERRAVTMDRVEWHMIDDKTGFIQIIEFNGNAYTLFSQALQELQAQGMQALVLDLRNNPGGNYDLVVAIADRLLPEGPIVTLVDKNGKELDRRDSDAHQLGIPLVVLINQYSASASELLAGNIKDYGVGTLVGVTTYGKGVGQNFYKFDDGAVARYTAFEYRTGGGNCPQDVGIEPDIPVELNEEALSNPLLRNTPDDAQYMAALSELQKKMTSTP
jgi:carboxyl-terminal processing protease